MNPSLFHISFILFFIGIASAAQDVVKDATGKKVLNNVPYHIGPATTSANGGGGFKLTDTMNNKKICPVNVVQEPSASNLGDAFTFTLVDEKRPPYLLTTRNLGIDSGFLKGPCEKYTFWTIPDAEAKPPENLVTTGGRFEEDITCFQLVKYPKPSNPKVPSYMLQHCPYYCGGAPDVCFNVSSYVDKGVRRLASKGTTPFEFVFHKVPKKY